MPLSLEEAAEALRKAIPSYVYIDPKTNLVKGAFGIPTSLIPQPTLAQDIYAVDISYDGNKLNVERALWLRSVDGLLAKQIDDVTHISKHILPIADKLRQLEKILGL